jgi:hypothetical protein
MKLLYSASVILAALLLSSLAAAQLGTGTEQGSNEYDFNVETGEEVLQFTGEIRFRNVGHEISSRVSEDVEVDSPEEAAGDALQVENVEERVELESGTYTALIEVTENGETLHSERRENLVIGPEEPFEPGNETEEEPEIENETSTEEAQQNEENQETEESEESDNSESEETEESQIEESGDEQVGSSEEGLESLPRGELEEEVRNLRDRVQLLQSQVERLEGELENEEEVTEQSEGQDQEERENTSPSPENNPAETEDDSDQNADNSSESEESETDASEEEEPEDVEPTETPGSDERSGFVNRMLSGILS